MLSMALSPTAESARCAEQAPAESEVSVPRAQEAQMAAALAQISEPAAVAEERPGAAAVQVLPSAGLSAHWDRPLVRRRMTKAPEMFEMFRRVRRSAYPATLQSLSS